jgi:hypothetical protein
MPFRLDELLAHPDHAAALAARLDPRNSGDRDAALAAIEALVDRFVAPAAELRALSSDGDEHWFDLSRVAGVEVPGLVLGLLSEAMPALEETPDNDTLAARLDEFGVEMPRERQAAFVRAWTALRACHAIRPFLDVLEPAPSSASFVRSDEQARLERLREAPLPGLERQLLDGLVAKLERRARRT